eukprot:2713479-Rhodomonas_salina.2
MGCAAASEDPSDTPSPRAPAAASSADAAPPTPALAPVQTSHLASLPPKLSPPPTTLPTAPTALEAPPSLAPPPTRPGIRSLLRSSPAPRSPARSQSRKTERRSPAPASRCTSADVEPRPPSAGTPSGSPLASNRLSSCPPTPPPRARSP